MGWELHIATRALAALGMLLVCGGAAPVRAGVAEVHLRDLDGHPVEDAVVSLFPAQASAVPAAPAPEGPRDSSMDQRDQQFAPHVLAVQRGTAVHFPNSDQIRHHVYSFSEAKRFELRLYSGVPAEPVIFDRSGTVVLGCNIHDDMIGFVRVVDTPWFAKSGANGVARIERVPAGRYRVELWHPRLPEGAPLPELSLVIGPGAPARLEAALTLGVEPKLDRPRRGLRERLRDFRVD